MWKYKINLIFNPESVIVIVLDYNNITRLRNNSFIDANGNNLVSLKYLSINRLHNTFQPQPGVFHPGSQFEGIRYQQEQSNWLPRQFKLTN